MANSELLVEQSFQLTFRDNVKLATQQFQSVLRPYVDEKMCTAEAEMASDIIGAGEYFEATGKERSNPENDPNWTRRWLVWRDAIHSGSYLDKADKMRRANDPSSQLMRFHMSNVQRGVDDRILGLEKNGTIGTGGLLGNISEGKYPGSSTGLPAAQTMAAGGAGLTMSKLLSINEQFLDDDFIKGMGRTVMAISSKQVTDLIGMITAAGGNVNMAEQKQIVEGWVARFMGIDFIHSNRLPKTGTTRTCVAWKTDNIVLGIWEDVNGDVFNDTHVGNVPYMEVEARMDCTRLEDKGVIAVECTEA